MENKELSFADIRKMRRGNSVVELYEFPFMKDVKIGIKVLSEDEIFKATIVGKREAEDLGFKDDSNIVLTIMTRDLLRRACFAGETGKPFFANIDEVGELSVDELNTLFDLYNRNQEKYAPLQSLETEEDFNNIIEEIKKKSVRGMSLNSYTLEKLVHFLIVEPKILQNDSGYGFVQLNQSKENLKKELGTKQPKVIKKNQ